MTALPPLAARLETRYTRIHRERMADLPILNPAIRVEVRGGHTYPLFWLGALITPWFINLVLLPESPDLWLDLRAGTTMPEKLQCGEIDFVVVRDEELGPYKACALISPVQDLSDQTAARLAADTALAAIQAPPAGDRTTATRSSAPVTSRRGFLTGRLGQGGRG